MLFRKQETFTTPQKLLVQFSVDKADAFYNILEAGNVIFL